MDTTTVALRHTWVPWVAAAAGAAFTLKVTLIFATGDALPDWPYAVLYLGGLLLGVVAAVGAGLRQRGTVRGVAVGLGAAALLVMWITGLGDSLKPLIGAFTDSRTAKDEIPILIAGLVLLALAFAARARDLRAGSVAPRESVSA